MYDMRSLGKSLEAANEMWPISPAKRVIQVASPGRTSEGTQPAQPSSRISPAKRVP